MKHIRMWVAIAVLLGGCSSGAADTAGSANAASTSGGSDTTATASGDVVPLESVAADQRDDEGALTQPTPLPPGTYRSSAYGVPVTFTTADELMLVSDAVLLTTDAGFSRILEVSQPDQVADLSRPISRADLEGAGQANIPEDRLIAMPTDVGAWLSDAEAIDVVDEGSTSGADEQAPWWDLELEDRGEGELVCQAAPGPPPCQGLWPGGPRSGFGAIVAVDTATRIWAVPAAAGMVMIVAQTQLVADDAATSEWFDTAEDIVASLQFD